MSYDLHITKADNWWESDQQPITREEVLELISSDDSLKFEDRIVGRNPRTGEQIIVPGEFIIWEKDGEKRPLRYDGKSITGPGYSETDAEIFKYIAKRLNARVQGDEGEFY